MEKGVVFSFFIVSFVGTAPALVAGLGVYRALKVVVSCMEARK